jgi:hypothetical protein
MSSNVIVDDLATVGRVESKIQFVIATIAAIVLVGISVYQLFFKKQYKAGLIFLAIGVFIFAISYYNNYLVSLSPSYAAATGANDIARALFK